MSHKQCYEKRNAVDEENRRLRAQLAAAEAVIKQAEFAALFTDKPGMTVALREYRTAYPEASK